MKNYDSFIVKDYLWTTNSLKPFSVLFMYNLRKYILRKYDLKKIILRNMTIDSQIVMYNPSSEDRGTGTETRTSQQPMWYGTVIKYTEIRTVPYQ